MLECTTWSEGPETTRTAGTAGSGFRDIYRGNCCGMRALRAGRMRGVGYGRSPFETHVSQEHSGKPARASRMFTS